MNKYLEESYKKECDYLIKKYDLGIDMKNQDENTLSELVQKLYDNIDFSISESTLKWNISINLLEIYLNHHYANFKETELVYRWAKNVCEKRNRDFSQWKSTPTHMDFQTFLNEKYK